jgi:electron transfer flavoprotein beta subunit
MSMNPFCEIALEEALRIKEAGAASEVVVVSMGSEKCTDVLRTGLAMGADRGIHVASDVPLHPMSVAKLLQALVVSEQPGLLLLGKQVLLFPYYFLPNNQVSPQYVLNACKFGMLGFYMKELHV